jgi:hypothetical protein
MARSKETQRAIDKLAKAGAREATPEEYAALKGTTSLTFRLGALGAKAKRGGNPRARTPSLRLARPRY